MRRRVGYRTQIAVLGAFCLAATCAGQTLAPADRERAMHYLVETRDGVAGAVRGLSDAQWNFKPAPDRWSISEVMEHLVLIEGAVHGVLAKIGDAPVGASDRDFMQMDALILARVPDRSTKVQAPPHVMPTGRWTGALSLEHFLEGRVRTIAMLQASSDLRGHVINHPVLGPLDGYEWILAAAAHCDRHTKQILEVKSDPHFPAS